MTREDLARARATLARVREYSDLVDESEAADIAVAIAHMDALLSIDDAEADKFVEAADAEIVAFNEQPEYAAQLRTLRALVRIIRRTV